MSGLPSMSTLVDLVLLVGIGELLLLMVWRRLRLSRLELLPNLLAGWFLMLALRLGVDDREVIWVAACLLAAGLSHVFDLRARWRAAAR